MSCETGRLTLILQRDGKEELIRFAQQGMKIYRKAVLTNGKRFSGKKRHFASTEEYKRKFIESYLEFKHTYITGVIR